MTVSYFDQTPSRSTSWKRAALLGFALGAQLLIANEAAAQEACGDSTCAKGFTCETIGGACPAIDCQDSADCKPCEPTEYHMCVPAACDSDSECGADQVCAEQVVYDCPPSAGRPEPACPPGSECDTGDFAAPTCTTSTVSYCTPRWQLPCTVAADCGAGFDCVPQERCSAPPSSPGSGSGTPRSAGSPTPPAPEDDPAPPSDPDKAELPAPPTTACEPTGYSACVPIQVACDVDADCLSGWTCQANPNGVCWSGPDGEGCDPVDPAKVCTPPYSGSRGGGEGTPANDGGSEPPVTAGPTPLPESPQGPGSTEDDLADAITDNSGGCSVSASPSTAGGLAWLVLGLAGVLGLRRRR